MPMRLKETDKSGFTVLIFGFEWKLISIFYEHDYLAHASRGMIGIIKFKKR